jgi:hypothetical protein
MRRAGHALLKQMGFHEQASYAIQGTPEIVALMRVPASVFRKALILMLFRGSARITAELEKPRVGSGL